MNQTRIMINLRYIVFFAVFLSCNKTKIASKNDNIEINKCEIPTHILSPQQIIYLENHNAIIFDYFPKYKSENNKTQIKKNEDDYDDSSYLSFIEGKIMKDNILVGNYDCYKMVFKNLNDLFDNVEFSIYYFSPKIIILQQVDKDVLFYKKLIVLEFKN